MIATLRRIRSQKCRNGKTAYAARYRHDPEFRAKEIMRAVLRRQGKQYAWVAHRLSIAARKPGGLSKVWDLLGYTQAELLAHLQSRFTDGMTMADFQAGRIHIDHIIPKAAFKLDTIEDLRACHALTNLQPLWAKDNLTKGARLDWTPSVAREQR